MPQSTLDVLDLPRLPTREPECHKGDFGRILVVAGSRGMSGAAVMTGLSALRGGAGLVRVATASSALPMVAVGHPCLMTAPLPEDAQGRVAFQALQTLTTHVQESTVLAIGPGLGRSPDLERLVPQLLGSLSIAAVLDADGLNAFLPDVSRLSAHQGPLVITPHPGEFARLAGVSAKDVQANRRQMAEEFSRKHNLVVVLKGRQTVVTDGHQTYLNSTGNPGMATAGSGDVLTGLIAALMGQKLAPFSAAQLAVFLHGRAADLAAQRHGEVSLIATDLIESLSEAIMGHQRGA